MAEVHTERERDDVVPHDDEVLHDDEVHHSDCHRLHQPVNIVEAELLAHSQLNHAAEQTLLLHHDRSL